MKRELQRLSNFIVSVLAQGFLAISIAHAKPSAIIQPPADGGGAETAILHYECSGSMPSNGNTLTVQAIGDLHLATCTSFGNGQQFFVTENGLAILGTFCITPANSPGLFRNAGIDIEVNIAGEPYPLIRAFANESYVLANTPFPLSAQSMDSGTIAGNKLILCSFTVNKS